MTEAEIKDWIEGRDEWAEECYCAEDMGCWYMLTPAQQLTERVNSLVDRFDLEPPAASIAREWLKDVRFIIDAGPAKLLALLSAMPEGVTRTVTESGE